MCFGLVISTVAKQEVEAIIVALSAVFPTLLLSGIIWPLEAVRL